MLVSYTGSGLFHQASPPAAPLGRIFCRVGLADDSHFRRRIGRCCRASRRGIGAVRMRRLGRWSHLRRHRGGWNWYMVNRGDCGLDRYGLGRNIVPAFDRCCLCRGRFCRGYFPDTASRLAGRFLTAASRLAGPRRPLAIIATATAARRALISGYRIAFGSYACGCCRRWFSSAAFG